MNHQVRNNSLVVFFINSAAIEMEEIESASAAYTQSHPEQATGSSGLSANRRRRESDTSSQLLSPTFAAHVKTKKTRGNKLQHILHTY